LRSPALASSNLLGDDPIGEIICKKGHASPFERHTQNRPDLGIDIEVV
jgi:hypothetical protein